MVTSLLPMDEYVAIPGIEGKEGEQSLLWVEQNGGDGDGDGDATGTVKRQLWERDHVLIRDVATGVEASFFDVQVSFGRLACTFIRIKASMQRFALRIGVRHT